MRTISIVLMSLFLFSCGSKPKPPPISNSQLSQIKSELASWDDCNGFAGCRWANRKVGYNADEGVLYIQVATQADANQVACDGYLDIIKKIHQKYASEYDMVGRVYKWGERQASCYVYGK